MIVACDLYCSQMAGGDRNDIAPCARSGQIPAPRDTTVAAFNHKAEK